MAIVWNQISFSNAGLESPGQMIPLILGIVAVIRVFYKAVVDYQTSAPRRTFTRRFHGYFVVLNLIWLAWYCISYTMSLLLWRATVPEETTHFIIGHRGGGTL
jgi:hypothetical protein